MAIFKLLNKYFLKSIIGPFCAFALPLFFGLIFFAIDKNQFHTALPAIISIGILAVTLMIIPTLIIDLRKSLILKRIGSSKISINQFLFILIIYFYIWILLSILFSFTLFAIIVPIASENSNKNAWKNHDVGATIYSALILGTMGIVSSIFIGTFCKNSMIASAIAFIVIIFSLFASGLLLPFWIIRRVEAIRGLNYFLPFNWPILMMQEAWGVLNFDAGSGFIVTNNNVWNIMEPLIIGVPQFGEATVLKLEAISSLAKGWNIVSPFIFIISLFLSITLAFKWTER